MNEPVLKSERISALVDDETDTFETRRLLDELLKSEEDRLTWSRYHLMGDCIRGGVPLMATPDFLAGLRERLREEENIRLTPLQAHSRSWARPLAGVGIAATVAAASLLAIQALVPAVGPGPVTENTVGSVTTAAAQILPAPADPELAPSGGPDPRFARYLENHAELLAPGSSAFARVRNSVDGE